MKRLMRIPDTVVSRAVAILAMALLVVHLVGYWAYSVGVTAIADRTRDHALAERLVSIKRAIAGNANHQERDRAAHALSSSSLEVHWSQVSLVLANAPLTERAEATAARLKELVPELGAEAFRIGFADDGAISSGDAEGYRHMLLVSMRLDDQSWINFATPRLGAGLPPDHRMLALSACIGVVIVVIAALLLSWLTKPLRTLANAAERFQLDIKPERIDERGPLEVRQAARAFNLMRERILTLVSERTQALAAVSHDLRTPITRVKLRAEMLDDIETRELIVADLAEMEDMVASTLEFLKGGESHEPRRIINLSSIAETLVDQFADSGRNIVFKGSGDATVLGQHLALKRVLSNLIGNALSFAQHVAVETRVDGERVELAVIDDGPGIPNDKLAAVFEPFFRLESSRNRQTGGVGLGLTIARSIAKAHGGDVMLHNRPEGGLRAVLTLPAAGASRPINMNASPTEAVQGRNENHRMSACEKDVEA